MAGESMNDVTQLLEKWRAGDLASLEQLAPIMYPELRRIAQRHLRRELKPCSLSTTELVNELYIRLAENNDFPEWDSRVHFYAFAARLIRQILVDEARLRRAQKRGFGVDMVPIHEMRDLAAQPFADVLALHDALSELARIDERKSRILELRYFGGLEGEQIATVLAVSPSTVARELRVAKAWLRNYLQQTPASCP